MKGTLKVKILPPPAEITPETPRASFGTRLMLVTETGEEIEVKGVTDITIKMNCADVIRAEIRVLEIHLPEEIKAELVNAEIVSVVSPEKAGLLRNDVLGIVEHFAQAESSK